MESLRGSDPMMNPPSEKNKEGLTFREWHAATGQVGSSEDLVKAWENGEDPSEYRIDHLELRELLPDLSTEERVSLVALVVTRTKLNSVRAQLSQKREELTELEKQRHELVKALDAHGRKFAEGFGPIPLPIGEEY